MPIVTASLFLRREIVVNADISNVLKPSDAHGCTHKILVPMPDEVAECIHVTIPPVSFSFTKSPDARGYLNDGESVVLEVVSCKPRARFDSDGGEWKVWLPLE